MQIKEVSVEEVSSVVEGVEPDEVIDIGVVLVSRYKGTVMGDFLHVSAANGRQLLISA